MASQFVGKKFKAPTGIQVAVERSHATVLACDEGLRFLLKPRYIVERRSGVSLFDYLIDPAMRCWIIAGVKMPRIDVGLAVAVVLQMFPSHDAHVFNQPRMIK